jgi:hypothetical protein
LKAFDLPAHLLTSFTGRQADEVDPDGAPLPRPYMHYSALTIRRTCGGRTEGNIYIMGTIYLDHAAYHGTFHELLAPAEEDTSSP